MNNLELNTKVVKRYAVIFGVACFTFSVVHSILTFRFAEKQRHKIYVLDDGKSLMLALSQDLEQNRPVEARQHIRNFHELFFTYAPDKAAIESNISRALILADNSALSYYKVLLEKGYFTRLIAGNVNQTVHIDSVKCDTGSYPYMAVTYGKQKIIRSSTITERSLITSCRLIKTVRSDDNPHGFMIEDFKILKIKTSGYMKGNINKVKGFIKQLRMKIQSFLERLNSIQRIYAVITMVLILLILNILSFCIGFSAMQKFEQRQMQVIQVYENNS